MRLNMRDLINFSNKYIFLLNEKFVVIPSESRNMHNVKKKADPIV